MIKSFQPLIIFDFAENRLKVRLNLERGTYLVRGRIQSDDYKHKTIINKFFEINLTVIYYVKDASGNVLSVYDRTTNGLNYEYRQKEAIIYGSSRLGITRRDVLVRTKKTDGSDWNCISCVNKFYWAIDLQNKQGYFTRNLTKKEYELSDHLGNVKLLKTDTEKNQPSSHHRSR